MVVSETSERGWPEKYSVERRQMILQGDKREIYSSGVIESTQFSMKMDAQAFRLMSDNLYTDKIMAVCREYITNAIDATIESGNSIPVEIHVPTALEPFFSVRDYGTGLSKEDTKTLYSTYFDSTKRSSNEVTGCFGLGSKAAFAYTDSFTVVSIFNGSKYTFAGSILEDGIPNISLLEEVGTDERNGLTVTIPCKKNDANTFITNIQHLAAFLDFPIKWNMDVPPSPLDWGNNDFLILSATECREKGIRQSYGQKDFVVQGRVAYPISASYTRDIRSLLNQDASIFIRVSNGTCSLQTSREALSYDKKTESAISEVIDRRFDQIKTKVSQEIEQFANYRDAIRYLDKKYSVGLSKIVLWRGFQLHSLNRTSWDNPKYKIYYIDRSRKRRLQLVYSLEHHYSPNKLVVIYEDAKITQNSLTEWLVNKPDRSQCTIFLIRTTDGFLSSAECEAINYFNIPDESVLTSEIPRVKVISQAKEKKSSNRGHRLLNSNVWSGLRDLPSNIDTDVDLFISKNNLITIYRLWNSLKLVLDKEPQVYLINETLYKKYSVKYPEKTWAVVLSKMKDWWDANNEEFEKLSTWQTLSYDKRVLLRELSKYDKSSRLAAFTNRYNVLDDDVDKNVRNAIQNYVGGEDVEPIDLNNLLDEILNNNYPLLKCVIQLYGVYDTDIVNNIAEYIKLKDKELN